MTEGGDSGRASGDGRPVVLVRMMPMAPTSDSPADVATSGGVELTDELLDTLAAEAERGYDIARLRPRRGKRPDQPTDA